MHVCTNNDYYCFYRPENSPILFSRHIRWDTWRERNNHCFVGKEEKMRCCCIIVVGRSEQKWRVPPFTHWTMLPITHLFWAAHPKTTTMTVTPLTQMREESAQESRRLGSSSGGDNDLFPFLLSSLVLNISISHIFSRIYSELCRERYFFFPPSLSPFFLPFSIFSRLCVRKGEGKWKWVLLLLRTRSPIEKEGGGTSIFPFPSLFLGH